MSDFIELLPLILIAAVVIFKRVSKIKIELPQDSEFEQEADVEFEIIRGKTVQPTLKSNFKRPKVEVEKTTPKIVKTNDVEEKIDSILPSEIDWQQAVIYSEIFKPKFDD